MEQAVHRCRCSSSRKNRDYFCRCQCTPAKLITTMRRLCSQEKMNTPPRSANCCAFALTTRAAMLLSMLNNLWCRMRANDIRTIEGLHSLADATAAPKHLLPCVFVSVTTLCRPSGRPAVHPLISISICLTPAPC